MNVPQETPPQESTPETDPKCDEVAKLPCRVSVTATVSSRYPDHKRPGSWDLRLEGNDIVKTADGKTLKLWSDGGQSPPKPGWILLLSDGDSRQGYSWTLYGIPPGRA